MPYKSITQERYFNANRARMERQGVDVDEWNQASKGMKLPMKTEKVDLGHKGSFNVKKGALHRDLGVPLGERIPESKLNAAEHSSNPTVRRRAISAKGFRAMNHG